MQPRRRRHDAAATQRTAAAPCLRVIWYALSLALCVEIGALAGWMFGAATLGVKLAVLPHGLFWLWLLASDGPRGG